MAEANPNQQQQQLALVEVQVKPEDREYRKGNWTLHETVTLITAKKLDDQRRLKGSEKEKSRPAELRWKWVENYCWKNGCQRSQNQCNDKWDNLLRDYKKVRDYESRYPPEPISYWQMEKHERKEKGLPSNLLQQVYQTLHDVIDRRFPTPKLPQQLPGPSTDLAPSGSGQQQQQLPHPLLRPSSPITQPSAQKQPAAPTDTATAHSLSGDDSSEEEEAAAAGAKRRKTTMSGGGGGGAEAIAPAMFKSTVEITQTLLACEDKKDRRHRDLLGVEERKLHIEEAKTEISRAGVAGLITAVNNLASAILTLAADKTAGGDTL
ncbi:unnamed protein product [Sphagnum jensenii]|uniref:Myb-like domain-containing protein n=1 Tax=Sphagnum jensenii TaxID=128206 RepID=A0ABP1BRX1_9BRYO